MSEDIPQQHPCHCARDLDQSHGFALKLELWMGHEAAPVLDRVDGEDDVVHLSPNKGAVASTTLALSSESLV